MKKFLSFFLSLIMVTGIVSSMIIMASCREDSTELIMAADHLQIGEYFTMGKYNGEPILWRYVADDEHGKMIVSDKILCLKPFGDNNFWEESFPRAWLNSTVGEIEWSWALSYNNRVLEVAQIAANETGFLNDKNFSAKERAIMKPVTQWIMLPPNHLELSTNENFEAYEQKKVYRPGSPKDGGIVIYYDIADFPESYYGAAYEVTDTVFLMDEMQVYRMNENIGEVKALCADECEPPFYSSRDDYNSYSLRTPLSNERNHAEIYKNGDYSSSNCFSVGGIRPAFYLNESTAVILSGSGTEEDPYVVNGKDEDSGINDKPDKITVFYNDEEIEFDVAPIIENGRTLVPLRAVFEALGAEVGWEDETQTAIGMLNDTSIKLLIGSETAYVNEQPILLDVSPMIINNRTLVPLRFIAENFGYTVEWDEENQVVTIISN